MRYDVLFILAAYLLLRHENEYQWIPDTLMALYLVLVCVRCFLKRKVSRL